MPEGLAIHLPFSFKSDTEIKQHFGYCNAPSLDHQCSRCIPLLLHRFPVLTNFLPEFPRHVTSRSPGGYLAHLVKVPVSLTLHCFTSTLESIHPTPLQRLDPAGQPTIVKRVQRTTCSYNPANPILSWLELPPQRLVQTPASGQKYIEVPVLCRMVSDHMWQV